MDAVLLEKFGGPENLKFSTKLDVPEPGENEVVVKVMAAGVCHRDVIDRKGGFPYMQFPNVLGHEFSGIVTSVGPDVSKFSVGDRVVNALHVTPCGDCSNCETGNVLDCLDGTEGFGMTLWGAYAQYVKANEATLVKFPSSISFDIAAPVMCTAGVALHGLNLGNLKKGQTCLITGATGGVGVHAIQLAKNYFQATAIAVTGSESKVAALKRLGADHVIVSGVGKRGQISFGKQVREVAPDGIDVVLELTGEPTFDEGLRTLKRGGALVLIGNITAKKVPLPLGLLILNGTRVVGSHGCTPAELQECFQAIANGQVSIQIDRALPLNKASMAHQMLEDRQVTGRIILKPFPHESNL
eukprot:NODE_423_length_1518_cov_79.815960_g391_i0.p1 GENE.NODE_423_length_1518_cov_79.815960_g391_i0~~NODE_423_length_1518_cov_79.815960_g391_i0.p1  ORF type:complete len:356 (-),score=43.58 NODE_423_length_1518_cov_79.815960_g391_i0:348-1415(-)